MIKLLILLVSIFLLSCTHNKEEITYKYTIDNQTGAKVTDIIVYCYSIDKKRNTGYDRNLDIKYINNSDSTKVFETPYPYIRLFYAVNELEYYWQFPEKEDFFLMDQSIINVISLKKR